MLDQTTNMGRVVAAALKLAETRPWGEIALFDIAREAGVSLLDLKQTIRSKDDILNAFGKAVDDEVLRRSQVNSETGEGARDRLFGVLMTRFDVLQPYRAALKHIVADIGMTPSLTMFGRMMRSQQWMLVAAGIPAEDLGGNVRKAGLVGLYAQVMRVWLDDEDPGMARTMAELDKRLRSGERWMRSMDDMQGTMRRMAEGMRDFGSRARSPSNARRSEPRTDDPQAPQGMI
jgi:ubiquinone biosynthesis protein COQ9